MTTTPDAMNELSLSLQFGLFPALAAHRRVLSRRRVRGWIAHAMQRPAEVTVRIVGEPEARELNRSYRGKDYATNVLTFDYSKTPTVCADLVLCGPVVEREALAQGKPLPSHYAHLLIHASLHAQGYDHEGTDSDALEMEALEILLLGALGLANPY